MVDFAVAQDSNFKALRDGARIGGYGKKTDRSRIEFEYACRLLEMGFPEQVAWAEISACAKGSDAGPRYVDSTILAAAARVSGENFPRTTVTFSRIETTPSAFYTWKKHPGGFLSRVPVVNWSLPNVTVVMARPGGSKTTDLLDLFSTNWSGIGTLPADMAMRSVPPRPDVSFSAATSPLSVRGCTAAWLVGSPPPPQALTNAAMTAANTRRRLKQCVVRCRAVLRCI